MTTIENAPAERCETGETKRCKDNVQPIAHKRKQSGSYAIDSVLQDKILSEIAAACTGANSAMQVRVLLRPLGASPSVSFGADESVPSASTIKMLVFLAALRCVSAGTLTLTQEISIAHEQLLDDSKVFPHAFHAETAQSLLRCTLEELLTWMMVCSDNTATNVLIDLLGKKIMDETARMLALKNTALRRKMLDAAAAQQGRDNTTSAADQYSMFAALYRQKQKGEATAFLPPNLQKKAREILCAQRDSDVLLRYLWQPVCVAHKTGELATVRHDAGVFETSAPYFLAVLITGVTDKNAAEQLAGRIGKLAYEARVALPTNARGNSAKTGPRSKQSD